MKTLAIRIENEQHAQLSMIAQLEHLTMIDAIRQAIDQWIGERRNQPELRERAEAVLADIEHQAATRRGAIAALLGDEDTLASEPTATGGRTSSRGARSKGGGEASG